ncbi:helix-turn-helix domain-containing protein [Hymenobacter terrenus]|uniref:helix-turn-helix domain-containing protein n=1 Tax=Hymenobacter terrenus TaxID=1629124 RepID=UPI0006191310|nr:helix-turn-helix transcriptional regulator [Hymenobacter terrenus]
MARRSHPSPSLAAAVRTNFALTQAELARFMGVSRALVSAVEAGHKEFSEGPRHRLWVLARQLAPPDGQGPPAPAFALGTDPDDPAPATDLPGPLDPAPIEARLRRCRFLVVKARFELNQRHQPAHNYARRRWAVQVLRAALLPPGTVGAAPTAPGRLAYPGATPDPVADGRWLDRLALDTKAASVPLTTTQRALRLVRLHVLETEVKALEALLAG